MDAETAMCLLVRFMKHGAHTDPNILGKMKASLESSPAVKKHRVAMGSLLQMFRDEAYIVHIEWRTNQVFESPTTSTSGKGGGEAGTAVPTVMLAHVNIGVSEHTVGFIDIGAV